MSERDPIPLTIIVPAYDRHEKLERALESIATQDVAVRTIVVDDGSTRPIGISSKLSRALPLRLIRHPVNRGAAAARNTGLMAAETEWIAFLDSDDRLTPQTLGQRWRDLCAHQTSASASPRTIYGCGWTELDEKDATFETRIPVASHDTRDFASGCWFSPGSCIIINRNQALGVGLQDDTLGRLEDLDWFLSLALVGFVLFVSPVIGAAIERRRIQDPARILAAAAQIRRKWRSRSLPPGAMRRLAAYLDLEIAASYHFAGRKWRAMGYLSRSLARVPRTSLHLSPGWQVGLVPANDPLSTT